MPTPAAASAPSAPARPSEKPVDAVFAAKTALIVLAFVAAAALFAYACGEVLADYALVFAPTKDATVPWLIRMGVGSLAFLLAFGLLAVLVRPVWVAALAVAGGLAVYALVLGGGLGAWAGAGAGAAMLIAMLWSTVRQLENQIDYTLRPMGDRLLVASSVLAVLVAVPAGLGYHVDATKGGYVIPPRVIAALQTQADAYVEKLVDAQMVPAMFRASVLSAAKEQVAASVRGLDKLATPYRPYVPYALGGLAYFTFQVVLYVPGVVAVLLLAPLVLLLRLVRFVHVATETREVTRLTLARVATKTPEKKPDPWARAT